MTDAKEDHDMSSDDEDDKGKGSAKSRRELPSGAVSTLKAWLLSPDHFTHPYPTPQDQIMLMQKTGIDKKQLKNWFTNARRRIWKPMLKKQIDQGKLTATGGGGGGVAVVGPGLMIQVPGTGTAVHHTGEAENVPSAHSVHAHYQQAGQQQPNQPQQQAQQYDQFGNPIFVIPQQIQQQQQQQQQQPLSQNDYSQQFYQPQQQYAEQQQHQIANMGTSVSIGSLPPMGSSGTISTNISAPSMNKTDSHAVLMELFARDQDLVRQATESAKMKKATSSNNNTDQQNQSSQGQFGNQHPMKMGSQSKLTSVPSMNSWPHFSSISSLNNLGSMTGVKSITSMSGFDLASQGNLNKMGNLAQVKSMESMGKNDSYAFLEVFFGDRSMSSVNMAAGGKDSNRGVKRDREEDNDVGLSLDADETPPTSKSHLDLGPARGLSAPAPAPLPPKDPMVDTGTLKRAYDDALAARGLMSVSRSSENLSDLALPAKMQRTLSQQYLRQHQAQAQAAQQQQQQQQQVQHSYAKFVYPPANTMQAVQVADATAPQGAGPTSQQYPGQHPQQQQQQQQQQTPIQYFQQHNVQTPASDAVVSGEVQVPSASTCGRCHATGVDTQLRPCGHMFHERCLKPTLQVPAGQPKCPIDNIPIQSALLAVPTDETKQQLQQQQQQQQQQSWCEGAPAPKYNPAVSAESSSTTAA